MRNLDADSLLMWFVLLFIGGAFGMLVGLSVGKSVEERSAVIYFCGEKAELGAVCKDYVYTRDGWQ